MKRIFLLIALFVILPVVSAGSVICEQNSITLDYEFGSVPSSPSLTSCTNDGNITNLFISGSGVPDYINLGTQSQALSGTETIKLNVNTDIPAGTYPFTVLFDGETEAISVLLKVNQNVFEQGDIYVFPTSKVITVKQGAEKTQNILITVPSNYPRPITIQSVDFNPGTETITFGDLNLGQIAPGNSVSIPIIFSGKEASPGTYQTNLNIFATDSEGQIEIPTINLQLHVSQGVTPADENTFSTRPSCSLSASSMNVNTSYDFTCTNVLNNIAVSVQDSEYFVGESSNLASGIFTWKFHPKKFGDTTFMAYFKYLDSPIFDPFSQEVTITSESGQAPGTYLEFSFTPSLTDAKDGEYVTIQLIDNKTNSLVENPLIYINANEVENVSSNGKSFYFKFRSDTNYTIRGEATGYNDLVEVRSLESFPLEIHIKPDQGNSNSEYSIWTEVNATIFIDGIDKGNGFNGTINSGNHTIRAVKQGYFDTERTIFVEPAVSFSTQGSFQKGVEQVFTLSKNASWIVYFEEKSSGDGEIIERESLLEGSGDKITFTPKKSGTYTIESEGSIRTYSIEGFNLGKIWKLDWYWWAIIVVVLIGGFIYLRGSGGSKNSEVPFASSNIGGGDV